MYVAMRHIKRMHVSEAIYILSRSHKKVAKKMLPTFFNLLDHASRRGLDPCRMFVHGLIFGKTKRYRGVRYHAKGRGNNEKTDICQIKVIFHEMPREEFYMKLANGETPPGFAQDIKTQLVNHDSSFETVRKYRHLITSRGRQQLKELNRRRVDKQFRENAEQNIFLPKKVILHQLLEKQIDKYEQLLNELADSTVTLKLRQALFKKNNEK